MVLLFDVTVSPASYSNIEKAAFIANNAEIVGGLTNLGIRVISVTTIDMFIDFITLGHTGGITFGSDKHSDFEGDFRQKGIISQSLSAAEFIHTIYVNFLFLA